MNGNDHPHLLHWYVLTELEAEERRPIERHLRWCGKCRDEAAALSSLLRCIAQDGTGPQETVPPGPRRTMDPAARAAEPEPVSRHAPSAGWRAVTAAAIGTLVVMAAITVGGRSGDGGHIAAGEPVLFEPPHRGPETPPVLVAPGPWKVRVLLPFGTGEGLFTVRVEQGTDPEPVRSDAMGLAGTSEDGRIDMLLTELPQGSYRLILTPVGPTDASGFVYPFNVAVRAGNARTD